MIKRSELNWITQKNNLSDVPSVNFLLSMGLIHKVNKGIFLFTPMGHLLLDKIKKLLTTKMNEIGYFEVTHFPLSKKNDFWNKREGILDEAFTINDYVIHPTSEETIFKIFSENTPKPFRVFSFSNNFRNETRPAFGLCRNLAFLMKDAYSMFYTLEDAHFEFNKVKKCYQDFFAFLQIDIVLGEIKNECEFLGISAQNDIKTCVLDEKNVVELGHLFLFENTFGDPGISFGIGVTRLLQFLASHNKLFNILPFEYIIVPKHPNNIEKCNHLYNKMCFALGKNNIFFDDTDKSFGEKMFDITSLGYKEEQIIVV